MFISACRTNGNEWENAEQMGKCPLSSKNKGKYYSKKLNEVGYNMG
jgi:hypothetical protein